MSVGQQSQTYDESVHLFSGYQYWKHRDFGANPEHPPLLKLVAALPLLSLDLKVPPVAVGPTKVANETSAIDFIYRNTTGADRILYRTRIAASVFTYFLAVLVFLCGREMFGPGTALLALALLVFEPNILANGALVTTDIAETCFLFASVYAFYRYVEQPGIGRLLLCGVAVGLAWASKHSGVLVGPILILLAVADILRRKSISHEGTGDSAIPVVRRLGRFGLAFAAVFAVGFVTLWSFYAFHFTARPGGAALNPTLETLAGSLKSGVETKLILALADAHILPQSYLWGLSDVFLADEGRATFLLGKIYATGQWFYFPLVLLMKCTIGFLVLLVAFPAARLKLHRGLAFLLIPPVVVLGISMLSGLNIGLRHVLPLFPFLILLAAATAMSLAARSRAIAWAVAVLVLTHAASSLTAYPNYLTYANEIVGGPSKAYLVMSNANVDWGQGLKQAAAYLTERHVTDCWFSPQIPFVDPSFFQIPCKPLPGGQAIGRIAPDFPSTIDGTILISTNQAAGQAWGPDELNPYKQFLVKTPDDIIGNSILVFHGSFDVSLASAYSHAARARQLITRKGWDDALREAQKAMQLFPDSAEVQATLCQVLTQTNRREEAQPVCEAALSIARRVHPEYQFLRVPNVRGIAAQPIE